jgi:broad-specificity NMP kinase
MKISKAYITGVSGTGKTTITNLLNQKGIKAYSLDEVVGLCHWVNKTDGKVVNYEAKLDREFIESHSWICDIEKLKKLINQNEFVVVLGLADNQEEFLSFFDKIILLQCKPEIFLKRIKERTDNPFGQNKSAQEYLLDIYKQFEQKTLENGAVMVNTEEPIEIVVENIMKQVK